jgi:hypothetical protein
MKRIFLLVSLGLTIVLSANAAVYTIPGVFSTGVDDTGTTLAPGTVDPHYVITSSPAGASSARVTDPYFMWWNLSPTSSAWINDSGTDASAVAGNYAYTLTFSLQGFDPATASITGNWGSDNVSTIFLNGIHTGFTHSDPGFFEFDAFALTSGFVSGLNTLTFLVTNDPSDDINPTGLLVQIQSATVPEPCSLALLGLFGAAWVWRKKGGPTS